MRSAVFSVKKQELEKSNRAQTHMLMILPLPVLIFMPDVLNYITGSILVPLCAMWIFIPGYLYHARVVYSDSLVHSKLSKCHFFVNLCCLFRDEQFPAKHFPQNEQVYSHKR